MVRIDADVVLGGRSWLARWIATDGMGSVWEAEDTPAKARGGEGPPLAIKCRASAPPGLAPTSWALEMSCRDGSVEVTPEAVTPLLACDGKDRMVTSTGSESWTSHKIADM